MKVFKNLIYISLPQKVVPDSLCVVVCEIPFSFAYKLSSLLKKYIEPSMIAHAFNLRAWELEAEELQAQGQSR